ncbi:DUF6401 family natural product biosynthesis protein [Nocardia sp. NPDC058666]|uniref:DUF6401 family natural product biosynthesis protein n=1 Tax=unclassified Nocardia TaxID=2637762 RepID=UPI0036568FB4
MFSPGHALLEISALRHLRQLNIDYGIPATAAAATYPAVLAELDQHAAAVRDILEFGVEDSARIPLPILLAGYVRGLLDGADELCSATPESWHDAEWLPMRLAAVCQHAAAAASARNRRPAT